METFHSNRFNVLLDADENGDPVNREDDISNPLAAITANREEIRVLDLKLKKINYDTSEAKEVLTTLRSQMVEMKL